MNRTVLILAAGKGQRFAGGKWWPEKPDHKQLLDVAGETVIGRIIRQCKARGYHPTVVTQHQAIIEIVTDCDIYCPRDSRWVMATLYSTREEWADIVTVLWGDVVYSGAVMDAMLAETRSPMFYGRWGDGFGMVFKPDDMLANLEAVLADAEANCNEGYPVGRNWEVYKLLINHPLHKGSHPGPSCDGPFYTYVSRDDYTQDLDVIGDYELLLEKTIKTGRLDDIREPVQR